MLVPLNKLQILEDRVTRVLELLKKLRSENEFLLQEKKKVDEQLVEKEKIIKKISKEKEELFQNQEILREKIEKMISQLEKVEEKKNLDSKKDEDELI